MSWERRPRVIIHIDLDAFYCQVEQKRHCIPRVVPCAVQQWEGLIAVNYAARAAGVTRHMRVAEAKKICPQLRTVHVETIGEGDSLWPGRGHSAGGVRGGGSGGGGGGAARRNEAKASLQPYRQASREIMRVLSGLLGPGCLLEKASVDEAFLDVTAMAEEELQRLTAGSSCSGELAAGEVAAATEAELGDWDFPPGLEEDEDEDGGGGGGDGVCGAAAAGGEDGDEGGGGNGASAGGGVGRGRGQAGIGGGGGGGTEGGLSAGLLQEAHRVCEASVVVGGPPDLLNDTDRRLVVGAMIALRLRRAVRAELDFTCSAGVAPNKLLAKVGSARNKPDKQTLVLPRGVPDLMQELALSKLRGLGGKLGSSLEQHFGATSAGQVQQLPLEQLQRVLGERTGLWVSQVVRGHCMEAVTPKDKPKSLLSCKSFDPTRDLTDLARWLTILAEELAQRCREDEEVHLRRARTLVLHYRGSGPRERSVRCPMPQHGREGPSPSTLAKAGLEMLRRQPDALPCSRLALAATEFDDPPAAGARAITRFFSTLQPQHHPAQERKQHEQQQQLGQPLLRLGLARHQQQFNQLVQQDHQTALQEQRRGGKQTQQEWQVQMSRLSGTGIDKREGTDDQLAAWNVSDGGDGGGGGGDGDGGGGGDQDGGDGVRSSSPQHGLERYGSTFGDIGADMDEVIELGRYVAVMRDTEDGGVGMQLQGRALHHQQQHRPHPQPQQGQEVLYPLEYQQQPHHHHHRVDTRQQPEPYKRRRVEDAGCGEDVHLQGKEAQQQLTASLRPEEQQQQQQQQQPVPWPTPTPLSCWPQHQWRGTGTASGEQDLMTCDADTHGCPNSMGPGTGKGCTSAAPAPAAPQHEAGGTSAHGGELDADFAFITDGGWAPSAAAVTTIADGHGLMPRGADCSAELNPSPAPCPGSAALDPDPGTVDLLSGVDLDEQRRILHEIELARLRAAGRPAGSGTGAGAAHGARRPWRPEDSN